MTDIKADIRVEHPDLVCTESVTYDQSSKVISVSEAGTDPASRTFYYYIESSDFHRFDDGLQNDNTVAEFERVIETRAQEAIYCVEYSGKGILLSPVISAANGVVLDKENDGSAWLFTIWMTERADLRDIWEYAQQNDIDIELLRVNEYASLGNTDAGLTDSQREALLVALETGYLEEPRKTTLGEVAAELNISQPAAGGLLRRGVRRLIISSLLDESETSVQERNSV